MGDATDGGAATTGDAGAATSTSTTTAGTVGTGTQLGDGAKGGQSTPKTFTQEDLDRIVSDRVARATKQFGDYEDLKAAKAELDKLQAASKTELERATDRAAESERRSLQLETALADAQLKSTVLSAAARKGLVDPDAAFRLLDRSQIVFDKAGDPTNLDTVLDDLLRAKPYLSGKPGNGSGEGGPRGGAGGDKGVTGNEWFHSLATGRRPQQ